MLFYLTTALDNAGVLRRVESLVDAREGAEKEGIVDFVEFSARICGDDFLRNA